MLYSMH